MKRNIKRLPALLLAVILCLSLLPVTALAAGFPSKFYASITLPTSSTSSTVESFGTVSSNGIYAKTGTTKNRVISGMESAGGVFFTVEGNRGKSVSQGDGYIMEDDGWRELRMYNSSLTSYRTIGTVNQANGACWIVDTAMDLSGEEPALYGTYNLASYNGFMSVLCTIDLETAKPYSLIVSGLPDTDIIYAMAFDENGTLYAIGADAGDTGGPATLYTITLSGNSATASKVGEIKTGSGDPISTNFAQDLDFDYASGTLYWAENKGNVVYTVDTKTAVATRVGQVKYNNKAYALQSFCFPKDTAFGQNDDRYMVSVICEGAGTVTSNGENKPFYMVNKGDSIKLDIAFNPGGADSDLLGVTVDGKTVSISSLVDNSYTFSNVTKNHVIEVKLKKEIPATKNTVSWLHYQGEPASFYTVDNVYKFYDLPYLDQEVPREGYTQTLLDEDGEPIDNGEIILPGNYDVHVTHPGNADYAALDVTYTDALQLGKCPGTPGRPVVYGKVGCTQGDLSTTSALQDYYGSDGNLINSTPDEIPVTLVWQNPEITYDEAGNFYASATIYAGELSEHILACYTLDDGEPLEEGCLISHRSTQVIVLPANQASLIKLQTSDASGGTVSGKGVYKNGETVIVTAAAASGYTFRGWQENGEIVYTGETYSFTADGDRTLTALFTPAAETYYVSLSVDPAGAGTVTGGGSYDAGDHNATVTATANPGYYFMGWYNGETQASTENPYTFTVTENGATLTAKFDIDYLARAEQAKTNFDSALGTSAFEWQTLVQAVDAYKAAEKFVNDNPPSVIENAMNRFNTLTDYYNKVQTLNLPNQGIDNADLAKLYLFTGVTELNLSGNKGVSDLSNLPNPAGLETLNLSGTGVSDLSALERLTNLETLDLSNTAITNDGLSSLSGLTDKLKNLDISGTGVTTLDSLVSEGQSSFPGSKTLTAQNLFLTSLSGLANLVSADDFDTDDVTKWDFTGSTLPDSEDNKADVETIKTKLGDKFSPPTIKTTPTGGGGGVATYAITVEKAEHGKVTASPTQAGSGSTVTLTVKPDEGYALDTLTVTDAKGGAVKLTDKGNGKYTFDMPNTKVEIRAVFRKIAPVWENCPGGVDCPAYSYRDVDTSAWYHEAVDYVLVNGLMSGYGNGLFGPNDNLSRAQLCQILYNKEGRPAVTGSSVFIDMEDGAWYLGAVTWAAKSGIVGGYGNGLFGPEDNITREQLAAILYRYARAKGYDVSVGEDTNILSYTDALEISEYAIPAMQCACGAGIIQGNGGYLNPQGDATRAEIATMLMRFCEYYADTK